MTVSNTYSSPSLNLTSNTGNYSYALVIPGSEIRASGSFARMKFATTLKPRFVYVGHGTISAFSHTPSPVVINSNGWSEPFELEVIAGQSIIVRLDVPSDIGQTYPYATKPGFSLHFKSGQQGASNQNISLPSGYTAVNDWAAMVEKIDVAETLEAFSSAPNPSPNQPSFGFLAELELRAMSNHIFAAGQNFVSSGQGMRRCFALHNPSDKTRNVFADVIELTLDKDSEVTLRSFIPPLTSETFNSICNVNFTSAGPNRSAVAKTWLTASDPKTIGGRHTTYMVKAGQTKTMYAPRGFLAALTPGGSLAVVIHEPNTAAHISIEWHETPL